jgi:ABC-type dipeptide/oligopeptide/nickel transport system permease subunit
MTDPTRTVASTDVAEVAGVSVTDLEPTADYEVSLKPLSQWQLAFRRFRKHRMAMVGTVLVGMMVVLAIIGPILWPFNRLNLEPLQGNKPPSLEHIFGTDNVGRPVFNMVATGARLSMIIGLGTMMIATTIGVLVGATAGFVGGRTDGVLMRFVDLLLALPFLFIILVASVFFGQGDPLLLLLIFGLLSWAGLARLVRALFLSLREQEYVMAAKAVGVSSPRIAFRHMLPNALGPIIVSATLIVASAIVLEAIVSFLNLGVRATDTTWGTALSSSQEYLIRGNWWWPFFPGMAIAITVIGINFMGDGLRDAFDPRARA